MVNITDIAALEPLISPVKNLIGTLEIVLGGIFGLYLLFAIIQFYYTKRKDRILNSILEELRNVRARLDKLEFKKK